MQTSPFVGVNDYPLVPDDGVLCIHFAAGGRDHSMWYLDADDLGPALSGFTALLTVEPYRSPAGFCRANVLRRGGNLLCDALFLGVSSAAGSDRDVLRDDGIAFHPASLLASIRQRPVLATFARRLELPLPLARHVHGLLLRTMPTERPARLCGGAITAPTDPSPVG